MITAFFTLATVAFFAAIATSVAVSIATIHAAA